jgi:hypothetical protein
VAQKKGERAVDVDEELDDDRSREMLEIRKRLEEISMRPDSAATMCSG